MMKGLSLEEMNLRFFISYFLFTILLDYKVHFVISDVASMSVKKKEGKKVGHAH